MVVEIMQHALFTADPMKPIYSVKWLKSGTIMKFHSDSLVPVAND